MTPQERDLLTKLFDRLAQCEGQPTEPEAAAFISDAVARHPGAPYFMAQLLLVQDRALSEAHARIRALEQTQPSPAANAAPSFLPPAVSTPQPGRALSHPASVPSSGHATAPGARDATYAAPPPPPQQPAAGGQWGSRAGRGAGGFLRGAAQTAAGVAGGALLFEGINALFHHSMPWGMGGFSRAGAAPTVIDETVINAYGQPQPLPDAPANAAFDSGPNANTDQIADPSAGFEPSGGFDADDGFSDIGMPDDGDFGSVDDI